MTEELQDIPSRTKAASRWRGCFGASSVVQHHACTLFNQPAGHHRAIERHGSIKLPDNPPKDIEVLLQIVRVVSSHHTIDLILNGTINPGKVFDLTLPLEQVAEGYRAMDERRAIKTLLRP